MISTKAKYSYGLGAFGKDMAYAIVALYALFFFTDVAGVSPAFIGTLFLVARLWDAVNDPIMGWIVDNTRGRFGKFRPWILIGTALNALATIALFFIPGGIPLEAYIAVTYIIWGMTYTLMDIPFWSMIPALSKTPKERERLAIVPRIFASFAWLLLGVGGLWVIKILGGGNEAQGYLYLAIGIAVIFVITSLITFFNVKEIYPADPNAEKVSLGGAWDLLRKNSQLRVLVGILIAFNLVVQIAGGSALYYFKYVVGNENVFAAYSLGMGVAQIGGLLLLPRIADKLGRVQTFTIASLLPVLGFGSLWLVGQVAPGNVLLTVTGAAIANLGVGLLLGLTVVMMADVVDYGEFKFGTRNESVYFSVQPLAVKFAMAIAGWTVGMALTVIGYDADATVQNASTVSGLQVLMLVLPALMALVGLFIYRKFYKLNGAFQAEVLETLELRHSSSATQ